MAQIVALRKVNGVAGQVQYVATIQYDDGDKRVYAFVGSEYGAPGPVYYIADINHPADALIVTRPERFGVRFNESWVRNFYAPQRRDGL
jgi:hypothetical protein